MKIENIKIQNGSDTKELVLSTDNQKNVNLIIGQNDSGKTRTFNEIKSYFQNNKTDSKIEIKLTDTINSPNVDLMFACAESLQSSESPQTLLNFKEFSEDNLSQISKRLMQLLVPFEGVFLRLVQIAFGIENNKRILYLIGHGGHKITSLAHGPTIITNLALLIAIREIVEPNLPLIIDGGFWLEHRFRLETLTMLSKNTSQLLLFLTDVEFENKFVDPYHNALPTTHDFLNECNMLGSVYVLKNQNFEKYV